MSLVGIATVFALAFALSRNRRAINWRTIGGAFAFQGAIAAFVLYFPAGQTALAAVVFAVQHVIDYGKLGSRFIFGEQLMDNTGFTVVFHVLPIIIFFSCLMSTLYHLGIMQFIVKGFGGLLHRLLQTSKPESMSAAANVFVGHTEAPLVIRPYLARMTQSELFAVMTGGNATIAGAVMAGYAALGVDLNYLITASFMAAPGGLLMAKLVMPETGTPMDPGDIDPREESGGAVNVFEAMGNGALTGLQLALNVGALLLAFVAMIALLNGIIGGVAGLFGLQGITLEGILGDLLAPLAFLLSVPWEEARAAASMIGTKLVLNEFIAYVQFIEMKDSLSAHTQVVITFALCGFANLASIAMLLGALGTMVPERRQDVARMGLLAVFAGLLANLMSAVLAGLFVGLAG